MAKWVCNGDTCTLQPEQPSISKLNNKFIYLFVCVILPIFGVGFQYLRHEQHVSWAYPYLLLLTPYRDATLENWGKYAKINTSF
jgi:hypothetical protein